MKKGFVVNDGATHGGSKLVLPERWLGGGEEAARVESVVSQEFIKAPMQLVRAALRKRY